MFLHVFLGSSNRFLDGQAVQIQVAVRSHSSLRRIAYNTFFCIKAFFTYVTAFYQRYDRQTEMFGKSIVTAVVCRHCHDGSCTVTGQYIVADPYRYSLTGKRIHGIRTTEYTGHTAVGNTFTLGTLLRTFQVSLYLCTLCVGSQLSHQFAFRSQHHEGYSEHGIGTGSKDSEFQVAVFHLEADFSTLRTTDPVTLSLFQRVGPVYGFQTVEQTLCIGRHTQTPLTHLLLNYRMTATFRNSVDYLIVGQYRTQCRLPWSHPGKQYGSSSGFPAVPSRSLPSILRQ